MHPSDVPTFETVYRTHLSFVARACRLLGVGSSQVDDVTQDVFVVVQRRLTDYESSLSLRGWLYGITRNVVRDHSRRAMRKESRLVSGELLLDRIESADDPEAAAARAQEVRLVERCLDVLSAEQREVFVLSDVEGLPASRIAEMVGSNPSTVYTRLRAARARLLEEIAARDLDVTGRCV